MLVCLRLATSGAPPLNKFLFSLGSQDAEAVLPRRNHNKGGMQEFSHSHLAPLAELATSRPQAFPEKRDSTLDGMSW